MVLFRNAQIREKWLFAAFSFFSEKFLKIFEKCYIDDYCSVLFYDDLRVDKILYR